MTGGYMGKTLNVELSNGKIEEEALDEKTCRDFIGGPGLAARVLFTRQRPGVDPLGPENILSLVTGPLTGSNTLFGTRYTAAAKSPLTSTWGEGNAGGEFGPYLKFSGYDAVFVSGISERPVYLFINDSKAELKDAALIWGKNTYETEEILKAELGDDTRVVSIGPSGEKVSLIASLINDNGRAAARCGLGAVMGAKKLKAIAVRGQAEIPLADARKIADLRKEQLVALKKLAWATTLIEEGGTCALTEGVVESGEAGFKNWAGTNEDLDVSPLYGERVVALREKKRGCWHCPIACGGQMKEPTGEYKWGAKAHKPEYETIWTWGPLCLNNNLESIIAANDICNRYGLDTISAGATIAFAIECYENGLITKQDTDGIDLTWGNHRAIVTMMEKMAMREGFGDVLADGSKRAAERIGKGAEQYAIHIHGEEPPAHDPKCDPGIGTMYMTDPTPASHLRGDEAWESEMEKKAVSTAGEGMYTQTFEATDYAGRGEKHKRGRCYGQVLNSSGFCGMGLFLIDWKGIVDNINAVTGWNATPDEMLVCGERIVNIRQAFNIREGITFKDFKIPSRVIGNPPLGAGPTAGRTVDIELMVRDMLKAMDWDTTTGKPSKEKLLSLGLDDVAATLWP